MYATPKKKFSKIKKNLFSWDCILQKTHDTLKYDDDDDVPPSNSKMSMIYV